MPNILIRCPASGKAIETGLDTETIIFETLPSIELPASCADCGQVHYWKPHQAWVEGDEVSKKH